MQSYNVSIIQGNSKVNIKVSERSKKAAERTVFNVCNSKKYLYQKHLSRTLTAKKPSEISHLQSPSYFTAISLTICIP